MVGEGVRLEESVVRDRAQGAVSAAELLFQIQRLLKAGLFRRRLGAGVKQCGVGCIYGNEASLLHLEQSYTFMRRESEEVTDA